MAKKVPQRMCVGCSNMYNKKELIRIVKNKEGQVFYDPIGKANGRGTYICKNVHCFDAAIENKKIETIFKQSLPKEVIDDLRNKILNEQ